MQVVGLVLQEGFVSGLYDIITTRQDPELIRALDQHVEQMLPKFREVLAEHPLREPRSGCCSVAEAYWLYALVRSLDLKVIVESGTFEGYSLYFLRRAAASDSRVVSFDPYVKPSFELSGVDYFATDWTDHDWTALPGERALIFFDDHLHHGRRLWQAHRHGVRHLVFHDNYVTSVQSHVPVRFVNLLGLARVCFTFPRLRCDPIFRDQSINPQTYRWLTYVELNTQASACQVLWRRLRYSVHMKNPYKVR